MWHVFCTLNKTLCKRGRGEFVAVYQTAINTLLDNIKFLNFAAHAHRVVGSSDLKAEPKRRSSINPDPRIIRFERNKLHVIYTVKICMRVGCVMMRCGWWPHCHRCFRCVCVLDFKSIRLCRQHQHHHQRHNIHRDKPQP